MELLGVGILSMSWAEPSFPGGRCGMSSSTPLVLLLSPSPPGGHWAADPLLQPRLCSQMLT